MTNEELSEQCLIKAERLIKDGFEQGMGVLELANLLYKMEIEKKEKDELSDRDLNFNDEIVEIEEVGDRETIDISVTGDHLFYCNGVLTKNSFGTPMTLDFYFALVEIADLLEENKILCKQLKNRLNNKTENTKFVLGLDKSRMKFFDTNVDISAKTSKKQEDIAVSRYNEIKKNDFSDFEV